MNSLQVVVREGEPLRLRCLVRGVPLPEVRWLSDGEAVSGVIVREEETAEPGSMRQTDVVISRASKGDEGTYQCEAENVYGSGVAK